MLLKEFQPGDFPVVLSSTKKNIVSSYRSITYSSQFTLIRTISLKKGFGDSFEHATGVEKWELTKKKEGNDVSTKI